MILFRRLEFNNLTMMGAGLFGNLAYLSGVYTVGFTSFVVEMAGYGRYYRDCFLKDGSTTVVFL